MKKIYDILTVFDCCADLVLSGGDIVPRFGDQEQFVSDYTVEMGGSGCIFAVQCAKLGLCAAGIGVVGDDDFGRIIQKTLRVNGVDTSYLRCDNAWKTGMGVTLYAEDDRAILTYNGTIDAVSAADITDEILSQTRHLHIASYYLMHGLQTQWPDIAKRAKNFGATISLDTNWDPGNLWGGEIFELLPYVDVFMPNKQEVKRISGKDSVKDAAFSLAEKVPLVVVKLGSHGAMAISGGHIRERGAYRVETADTVGAGDSFDSGFLWGYLRGMSIDECLLAGCFCGALCTSEHGGIRGQAKEKQLLEYFALCKRSQS